MKVGKTSNFYMFRKVQQWQVCQSLQGTVMVRWTAAGATGSNTTGSGLIKINTI